MCLHGLMDLMEHAKDHLNTDMKGRNGSRIRDVKLLHLKDLVFGAHDIDNYLMIKQDSSYILMINIKQRGYIYTII